MINIYIASHCRKLARALRREIYAATSRKDVKVVSRWLDMSFNPTVEYSVKDRRRIARLDFEDVRRAHVLVLISGPDKYTGGKFVEAGYALALERRVIVLGRRENMMLWDSRIPCVHPAKFVPMLLRHLRKPRHKRIDFWPPLPS